MTTRSFSSRPLYLGLVAGVLVGCGSRTTVDASGASASGGVQSGCCVPGVDVPGDPCGPDRKGICRGEQLECLYGCIEPVSGTCQSTSSVGEICVTPCPSSTCDPHL